IFVTHDQEEALSMSDRIVVMHEGRADQVGTPAEIYNTPATRFVASFVGHLSFMKATVLDAQAGRLQVDDHEIRINRPIANAQSGETWSVALRPESLGLVNGHALPASTNQMQGQVEEVAFLGSVVRIRVRFKEGAVSLDTFNNPTILPPERGAPVAVHFQPQDLLVLERLDS
ncbi:MAG TPA: TOBE domain-containing protein, partial [Verrucomicrobiae bacterium]|nr:TOBE domain-containing protein [Verrucomicrobiae bacterium]